MYGIYIFVVHIKSKLFCTLLKNNIVKQRILIFSSVHKQDKCTKSKCQYVNKYTTKYLQ